MANAIPIYRPTLPNGMADMDGEYLTGDGFDVALLNDGNVILEIHNPTGDTVNFQALAAVMYGGLAVQNLEIAVDPGTTFWIGPLPPAVFNQDDGTVTVSLTAGGQIRGIGV